MSGALTGWEKRLREAALLLAVVSLGFGVAYVISGVFGHAQFPFAANSVAKDLLLLLLAWLVFRDQRRWGDVAVPLIVLAHLALAIMLVASLGSSDHGFEQTEVQPWFGPDTFRWGWFASTSLVVVSFLLLHHLAIRSRYGLKYLTPSGFRALMALSEVLVLRDDREVSAAEVAIRVDRYLARFRAREKSTIKLALHFLDYLPVATAHPPFHLMSVDAREKWIQRRFLDQTRDWLLPRWARNLRTALIRAAQQFSFFGYYGDPRAARKCGYLPFSERPEYEQRMREASPIERRSVRCLDPRDVGTSLSARVVIVGTGAGGAMLAYELAARGCDVLMLERGRHVEPSTFTEDEAEQLSNLYGDGALQLAKDFRFRIAQGMCVGGSTVVNNAVCFDLPDDVAARWYGELQSGLEPHRLDLAFEGVRDFLRVRHVGPGRLNPGAEYFIDRLRKPPEFLRTEANILDCLGCGYCNIGCAYGRKLSALDWTLPIAQGLGRGEVRVLPECRVERVQMRGSRAEGVVAKLDDGRRITVRGQTVVLSAGALASSVILQRSGLGEDRAGQTLSFNIASPVTLDFDVELHSERGLQISHYVAPKDSESHGVALETWFNPIVAQSLFMPGWFDEHRRNMLRYQYMTCVGVVLGSASNGTVKPTRFRDGMKIDYSPTDDDFVKVKDGVRYACEIGLRAGARRAMPSTFRAMDISALHDLARIDNEIGDDNDLSLSTAHPQGGNPMSADAKRGVVDPEFRVYGTQNLFVCDASVFPSSITVNPQLTVMALAKYAADHIADDRPRPGPRQAPLSISHACTSGPGS